MRAFAAVNKGRPLKDDEKRNSRTRSAKVKDLGTPEQQQRKRVLVGDADPKYSEYPLGVLLARDIITQDQHDAGCRYAYLAGRVLGKMGPSGSQMHVDRMASGPWYNEDQDDAMEIIEPLWREACGALENCGRRVKVAVDNATYHRLWPVALIVRPGLAEFDLIDGLQALVRWRDGTTSAA